MATTSPFKQQCPGCKTPILIKDPKSIGKKAQCPKCQNKFTIEDPNVAEVPIEVVDTPTPAAKTQATPAAKAAPAAKPAPASRPTPKPAPRADEPIVAEVDEPAAERGINLTCPSCDAPITIKDPAQINKKIECPRCKYRFQAEPPKGESRVEPASAAPAEVKPARRGRFGEDPDDKPKPKVASNNLVLFLGIGLSVLAIALLGVGAFFIFFTGDDSTVPTTRRSVAATAATTPTTTEPATPATKTTEPALPELTHYLLNDTDLVCAIRVRELDNSIVGRAIFGSAGAFQKEQLAQAIGYLPEQIERVLIGYRYSKGNGLAIVRLVGDVDLARLQASLGLEQANESPIKRQEFYLTRPMTWLGNVRRIVCQTFGLPAPPTRPQALAVRVADKRTVVFSDPDTLREFLEMNGQPKLLASPDPKSKASPQYLTLAAPLRNVLDAVAARGALISLAWNLENETATAQALQNQLPADLPLFADLIRGSRILGVAVNMRDQITLTFAGDLKDPKQGAELESELRKYHIAFSQMGVPTELNQKMEMPPPDAMRVPPSQRPIQRLVLRSNQNGSLLTIDSEWALGPQGNAFVFSQVLRPLVLTMRGVADLAEEKPRLLELARALQDYVKKHDRFPRGTLARSPGRLGRMPPPDQRLSWLVELLPLLGYDDIYKELKLDLGWRPEPDPLDKMGRLVDENPRRATLLVPAFIDPESHLSTWWVTMNSAPGYRYATTHYVGIAGVGLDAADYSSDDPGQAAKLGVFGYDRETPLSAIKDGPAATIAIIEVPPTYRRPWMAGGGATVVGVPETDSIKPFVCREYMGRKGTFAIMADGSVRFIPETISDAAFKALCTISGGEKVDLDAETTLIPAPPPAKTELKAVTPESLKK